RRGFVQDYDATWVLNTEDYLYSYRSVFDGVERATARMSGIIRNEQDQWDRFEEYREITFYPPQTALETLHETGWGNTWIASTEDPSTPLDDPEAFDRVVFVAT